MAEIFSALFLLVAAEGQPCDPTGRIARDSMLDYCDSATLTCVPKIPVGGVCTSYDSCVAYADCDSTDRCVADARAGASCDEINGSYCLGDLVCNSGTCVFPPAHPVCQ
jgi:hypothetical protein